MPVSESPNIWGRERLEGLGDHLPRRGKAVAFWSQHSIAQLLIG